MSALWVVHQICWAPSNRNYHRILKYVRKLKYSCNFSQKSRRSWTDLFTPIFASVKKWGRGVFNPLPLLNYLTDLAHITGVAAHRHKLPTIASAPMCYFFKTLFWPFFLKNDLFAPCNYIKRTKNHYSYSINVIVMWFVLIYS